MTTQQLFEDRPARQARAVARVKVSKPRLDMGENVEAWEQKALDALVMQHPWTSGVHVHVNLGITSENGYGVGFFHLTPKQVPASAMGVDQVSSISIPIIIRDAQLCPLDLYYHNEQFNALTQERALRVLRLPDLFIDTARSPMDFELRDYTSDRAWRRGRGRNAWRGLGSGLSGKYSSASSLPLLEETLIKASSAVLQAEGWRAVQEKLSALRRGFPAGTPASLASWSPADVDKATAADADHWGMPSPDAVLREGLSKHASLACYEVERRSDAFYGRGWWRSSPLTGVAQVDDWEKVSMVALEGIYGEDRVAPFRDGTAKRHRFHVEGAYDRSLRTDFQARAEASRAQRREAMFQQLPKMSETRRTMTLEEFQGSDRPDAAMRSPLMRFFRPSSLPPAMLPEAFEGYPVHILSPEEGSADCCPAILTREGVLLVGSGRWSSPLENLVGQVLEPRPPDTFPEVKGVKMFVPLSRASDESKLEALPDMAAMVWQEGGALVLCFITGHEIEVDGKVFMRALHGIRPCLLDSDDDKAVWVCRSEQVSRALRTHVGERTVFKVPASAKRVALAPETPTTPELSSDLGAPPEEHISSEFGSDSEDGFKLSSVQRWGMTKISGVYEVVPDPFEATWPEMDPQEPQAFVRLTKHSGVYEVVLEGVFRDGWHEKLSAGGARSVLRFLGMVPSQAREAVREASRAGTLHFKVSTAALHAGDRVSRVLRSTLEPCGAAAQRVIREAKSRREQLLNVADALEQSRYGVDAKSVTSSSSLGLTVDAALSLGFLTKHNLLKFTDARPELEDSVSRMCALLVACRLGLSEIPEEALEAAIDSMEPVLQGLRVLEMSLKV